MTCNSCLLFTELHANDILWQHKPKLSSSLWCKMNVPALGYSNDHLDSQLAPFNKFCLFNPVRRPLTFYLFMECMAVLTSAIMLGLGFRKHKFNGFTSWSYGVWDSKGVLRPKPAAGASVASAMLSMGVPTSVVRLLTGRSTALSKEAPVNAATTPIMVRWNSREVFTTS